MQSINKRHELRVDLKSENMAARLPADVEVAVYRIVQEGLTNVLRHAEARQCDVELTRLDNRVVVQIRDDGVGFDPKQPRRVEAGQGLGLIGIRERVMQLGGQLRLDSTPGRGTMLRAEFQIPGDDRPAVEMHPLTANARLNP